MSLFHQVNHSELLGLRVISLAVGEIGCVGGVLEVDMAGFAAFGGGVVQSLSHV